MASPPDAQDPLRPLAKLRLPLRPWTLPSCVIETIVARSRKTALRLPLMRGLLAGVPRQARARRGVLDIRVRRDFSRFDPSPGGDPTLANLVRPWSLSLE